MKILLILSFLLMLAGCNGYGTNTGNPDTTTSPNFGSTPVSGRESNILGNALCNKIKSCFPASSDSTCAVQVQSLANFTDEIGLNPPYPTLADLEVDVQDTTFTFNVTSLNSCLNSISSVSCADSTVTSSYSLSSPNNFSNVYKLFRASSQCLSMQ